MISVEHLSFRYPGSRTPTLHDLSFEVPPGEIFGFLGPSGAGKSTTQKLLIGLLQGYEGRVEVLGRERHRWGADFYEQVGVAFEMPNHFLKLSARENLRYFRALYRGPTEEPDAVLAAVGLLPDGDRRVAEFSKGMRGRLTLARALLHRPRLLFLDEPTSGLDPVSARRVRALIREQQRAGVTIFLTTHDMAVADELCDRVAFIVEGRLPLVATPRALKLRYGRQSVRVEFDSDGQTASADYPLVGLGENEDFLTLLRAVPLQTIHTQETTLEEIFVGVTGRSLA